MTTFAARLRSRADVGIRIYVQIEGIPYVLLEGDVPVGPGGAAWSAPASKGHAYTVLPRILDVSDGLRDIGPEISRSTGECRPGGMTLVLAEDRAGSLLSLMARERADGNHAVLAASVGYDVTGLGSVLTCESISGWAASGLLYLGRETIYYPVIAGANFGIAPGNLCTRDLFSLGDGDGCYRHQTAAPKGPRLVSDYPRVWQGRYVRVIAYLVDQQGVALDSAYGDAYSQEIFRGVIDRPPRPAEDWQRWELSLSSIDSIVDTEVGREAPRGTLLRRPGGVDVQSTEAEDPAPYDGQPVYWISDDAQSITMRVVRYVGLDETTGILASAEVTVLALGGVDGAGPASAIAASWDIDAATKLAAAGMACILTLERYGDGVWRLHAVTYGAAHQITVYWDAPGGLGRLLGFAGIEQRTCYPGGVSADWWSMYDELALYLPAGATSIPFWVDTSEGLAASVPTSGYALIGGRDDGEIISYTGVTDASTTWGHGIRILTGVNRGRMSTPAHDRSIRLGEVGEEAELVFGVGWEATQCLEVLLQLAVSTGQAAHHSAYDLLPAEVSVPLCPMHWDLDGIQAHADQMLPDEGAIDLFVSQPIELRALASRLLRVRGLYLSSRPLADGTYRITVDRVLPPLEALAQTVVDGGDLDLADPAQYVEGHSRVLTSVELRPWDVRAEKPDEDRVISVDDPDAAYEQGRRISSEWVLVGLPVDLAWAYSVGVSLGYELLARYGRPYDLLRLRMGRAGLLLSPGDTLLVTVGGIATTTGARGVTARGAVVIQVERTWRGEAVGADVTVALEPYVRQSVYAPSARIASYTGGGSPYVTLHPQAYSGTGTDADWWAVGDQVLIGNEGDVSTQDAREIAEIDGLDIYLSAALVNALPVSATDTVMVPQPYDVASAVQQAYAHLAESLTPPELDGDDPYHWV